MASRHAPESTLIDAPSTTHDRSSGQRSILRRRIGPLTLALLAVVGLGLRGAPRPTIWGQSGTSTVGLAEEPVTAPVARRFTDDPDSVPVGGPWRAYGNQETAVYYGAIFSVAQTTGRQFRLRVENIALPGYQAFDSASITLNSNLIFGPARFASRPAVLDTMVSLQPKDTMWTVTQRGTGRYLRVTIWPASPTFAIFGPRVVRNLVANPTTPYPSVADTFALPASAGPERILRVSSGTETEGCCTLVAQTQGSVYLNGTLLGTLAQMLGGAIGSTTQVTLQATNILEVRNYRLTGGTSTLVKLEVSVSDTAKPVLTIAAPTAGLVTNLTAVTFTGTVTDQTAARVKVNGVDATVVGEDGYSSTVSLSEGANTFLLRATDAAGNITDSTRTITRDTQAPVLAVTSPAADGFTSASSLAVTGTVSDAGTVTVNLNGSPLSLSAGAFSSNTSLSPGLNVLTFTATDAAGNATSVVRQITKDNTPPALLVASPANGSVTSQSSIAVSGTATDASTVGVTINGSTATVGSGGAFSSSVTLASGANTIHVVATDAAGNQTTDDRSVTYSPRTPGTPEDPRVVAPRLDPTVPTPHEKATEFLYTGTDPIQTGVTPSTIDPVRVATVLGRVLGANSPGANPSPLDSVTVRVLGRPEFGQTLSRLTGGYDLVVNGGGALTLEFSRAGWLSAQRPVTVPWRDYAVMEDVILLRPDTVVTTIALGDTVAQVVRGSPTTDADGTRQATVIVPPGAGATVTHPNGSVDTLATANVRLTEYTVGEDGPATMPAPLTPNVAYTYAVNIGIDSTPPGAVVTFNPPLPVYVENFLGVPVGSQVPLGEYNPNTGTWVPQPDGRVIEILAPVNGVAQIDANGDGVADSDSALATIGITVPERVQLAATYATGTELARTLAPRAFPYDMNYTPYVPVGVTPNAVANASCVARTADPIRCEIQVARQAVGIAGAPFALHYASANTAAGRDRELVVALTPATLPAELRRVDLWVDIAGRRIIKSFTPSANLVDTVHWEGLDAYGRPVQGNQPVTIHVGYVFPARYQVPAEVARSFGLPCTDTEPLSGFALCELPRNQVITNARQEAINWQVIEATIGGFDAAGQGLGGWTPSVQHTYDPGAQTIYYGDGTRRSGASIGTAVVSTLAGLPGSGNEGHTGDGGRATAAKLRWPGATGVGADGAVYFATSGGSGQGGYVRRVGRDGNISTVAGTGAQVTWFFGQVIRDTTALHAAISHIAGVAPRPDGSVLILDRGLGSGRLLRLTTDGWVRRLAGGPELIALAEGVPALQADLRSVETMAVASDGTVYFAKNNTPKIWKIGADSLIHHVAGNGTEQSTGDGGQATQAGLGGYVTGMAFGADGSLYLATGAAVRRIRPDGIISSVVSTGALNVVVSPEGVVYYTLLSELRSVDLSGNNARVAGLNLDRRFAGDGDLALNARFEGNSGLAMGPDGALYYAEADANRVRKLGMPMPGFTVGGYALPSADGREIYAFDPAGRHLRTIDAITRDTVFSFTYDTLGQLRAVSDRIGDTTTIERDSNGRPTAVVSSNGERTQLSVNASGLLQSLHAPGVSSGLLVYAAGGLLSEVRDNEGRLIESFSYDSTGRIVTLRNAFGGETQLERANAPSSTQLSVIESGSSTSLVFSLFASGVLQQSVTEAGGAQTRMIDSLSHTVTIFPDGTRLVATPQPDPRFGMQASVEERSIRLPSGLTHRSKTVRGATLDDPADPFAFSLLRDYSITNDDTTTSTFDPATATLTVRSPEGRTVVNEFDDDGRVVSASASGLPALLQTFDGQGRLQSRTMGTRHIQYSYDSLDRVTSLIDGRGMTHQFAYDSAGRLTQRTYPGSRVVLLSYDAHGRLASITPPGRAAHGFEHNIAGAPTRWTLPALNGQVGETSFGYDSSGRLNVIERPDSTRITSTYSNNGTGSIVVLPGADTIVFNADSLTRRVLSITRTSSPTLTFSFDGGLVTGTSWTGVVNGSVEHSYNADLRPQTQSVNGGTNVTFTYDDDGLLTGAGAVSIGRDATTGRVTSETIGSTQSLYGYSSAVDLVEAITRTGSDTLFAQTLARDSSGRVTGKTEKVLGTSAVYSFAYDTAARLAAVVRNGTVVEQYEYDANGNRLSVTTPAGVVTSTVNALDQLVSHGTIQRKYRSTGELWRRIDGSDTTRFTYDALGQLRRVDLPSGTVIEYLVDGDGRRVAKSVNGVRTRAWLYAGATELVAELDSTGQVMSRFVYGTQSSVPMYMVRGVSTYRLVSDERGSVRLVVNAATGVVAQRLEYDGFGRVTTNTSPGFQPFGFAGGLYDEHTGLVRFGARDYDAEVGRWTARDPIGFAAGDANLYAYVFNDPINWIDPTGLEGTLFSQLQAISIRGALQSIHSPIPTFRVVMKKGACLAIEQIAEEVVLGAVFDAIYYARTAGDIPYVGRTTRAVATRLAEHGSRLVSLQAIVLPGASPELLSGRLADLEASVLREAFRDNPNRLDDWLSVRRTGGIVDNRVWPASAGRSPFDLSLNMCR